MLFGSFLPWSTKKTNNKNCQSWTPSDKTFQIHACKQQYGWYKNTSKRYSLRTEMIKQIFIFLTLTFDFKVILVILIHTISNQRTKYEHLSLINVSRVQTNIVPNLIKNRTDRQPDGQTRQITIIRFFIGHLKPKLKIKQFINTSPARDIIPGPQWSYLLTVLILTWILRHSCSISENTFFSGKKKQEKSLQTRKIAKNYPALNNQVRNTYMQYYAENKLQKHQISVPASQTRFVNLDCKLSISLK